MCDECRRELNILHEWENEQCAEERLVCPYCESSIDDPWYYDEDDEEVVCPECKRTFELEITTVRTYRTKRRIEDMPDGWTGEKSSLYICGASMDRLCDRLVGDGE